MFGAVGVEHVESDAGVPAIAFRSFAFVVGQPVLAPVGVEPYDTSVGEEFGVAGGLREVDGGLGA